MPATDSLPPASTKLRLLDSVEQLFAQRGVHDTATRDIVAAAGQRNESALQYHFGSREGLIDALHRRRLGQVQVRRIERLDALLATTPEPSVREFCAVLIMPVVDLCRADRGFIDYLRIFGEIALAPSERMTEGLRYEADSTRRVGGYLTDLLELDPKIAGLRFDALSRFMIINLSQYARNTGTFHGQAFELFINNLVDMVCGMLLAGVSIETAAALSKRRTPPLMTRSRT